MKIKSLYFTINRVKGKPLVYSINPLTIGPVNWAMISSIAQGFVDSENVFDKLTKARARKHKWTFEK